ncbi:CoxG family protein [Paenibacillus herberti]|uniref:Carbon monoxide dehydrogenase n=1 Tax=Paenibacillus herberti TaxID=1619309 RepID=A0A229NYA6_9BACL|nr:SRPBCC family protein [Paenibacillus herberti]OXM14784.1 carbon monoxide dehydrogenase [Paenibacillus herberti]
MPNGSHSVEIAVPLQTVWAFIKDANNWEPLVPGYIEHEILNNQESTWTFKGDLGFTKKVIKLQIVMKEPVEPTRVSFDLTGISDAVEGEGYFEAEALSNHSTKLTGYLEISGKGFMAVMMNSVMKDFVPKMVEELTDAVSEKLK